MASLMLPMKFLSWPLTELKLTLEAESFLSPVFEDQDLGGDSGA